MNIKRADWVCCQDFPKEIGCVKRIARDHSWIDVNWGPYAKRIRKPETLQIVVDHHGYDQKKRTGENA